MSEFQEPIATKAALYVDGFNLYHALHDNGDNFLKWLNLWRLGELLCEERAYRLVKVVFCTALPDEASDSRDRHITYINALSAVKVTVIRGHHITDPESGKRTEKQSDVNLALSLICDAADGVFDVAYLLTADSDQAATGRVFKERHPEKALFSVSPIKRPPPQKLRPFVTRSFELTVDQVEKSLFPVTVMGAKGGIRRPAAYDPPDWWVHPDQRPRKK
ncbi:MAG TPA: NYN domain-containing protein [Methylosinus sp.]|jgi:uncharacterized LabA/DUF88 family protein